MRPTAPSRAQAKIGFFAVAVAENRSVEDGNVLETMAAQV